MEVERVYVCTCRKTFLFMLKSFMKCVGFSYLC